MPSPIVPDPASYPERVGRYEILVPIASGGMATVYLARAQGVGGFERDVALKLTHAHLREEPEFVDTLLQEAKLTVSIRHMNVVSVLDVGDDPRGLFLVMDYVEGASLSDLQKRAQRDDAPVPPRVKARVLLDALAGLHASHEARDESGALLGLIHRDFTPQNLLVGVDGVTRLTDFGVAKALTQLQRTASGMIKGKAAYMSPEQARGETLDRRCDVWAAGVVSWELLAGARLFRAENEVATLLRVLTHPAPPLTSVAAVGPDVEQAVARALAPELDARWPTAAALRQALLEAFTRGPGVAEHDEVGAYVRGLVGPKLEERRAAAAEVIRSRRRPTVVETSGLPETPSKPRPSITVAEAPLPAARAEQAKPVSLVSPVSLEPASLSDPPASLSAPPASPAPASEPALDPRVELAPRSRPTPRVVAGLIAAAAAAALGVAWLSSGRAEAPAPAPASALASTLGTQASRSPLPPAPAPGEPGAGPGQAGTAARRVVFVASAPVSSVRLGARTVRLESPDPQPEIELSADEASTTLEVVLSAADGRRAQLSLPPGTTRASASFGPAPKRPPRSPPPLAPSPYGRR